MGSKRRFAYSAIGDSVNLAARVETLTGTLNRTILITDQTRQDALSYDPSLGDLLEGAGDHLVKGRRQPVTVHVVKMANQ